MKTPERGTPLFGLCLGIVFVLTGVLIMTVGFWKTLIIAALFAAGYFLGAVKNKTQFFKDTVNRMVPEKNDKPINFREEIAREQESLYPEEEQEPESAEEEDGE